MGGRGGASTAPRWQGPTSCAACCKPRRVSARLPRAAPPCCPAAALQTGTQRTPCLVYGQPACTRSTSATPHPHGACGGRPCPLRSLFAFMLVPPCLCPPHRCASPLCLARALAWPAGRAPFLAGRPGPGPGKRAASGQADPAAAGHARHVRQRLRMHSCRWNNMCRCRRQQEQPLREPSRHGSTPCLSLDDEALTFEPLPPADEACVLLLPRHAKEACASPWGCHTWLCQAVRHVAVGCCAAPWLAGSPAGQRLPCMVVACTACCITPVLPMQAICLVALCLM